MTSLKGKTICVTGGGQGLGAAICRNLAAAGAHLAVCDIDRALGQEVADRVSALGVRARAFELDVGDEARAGRVVQEIIEVFGRLDVLVNNAGTDVTLPLEELTTAQWDRVLRTNLYGPFIMSKLALPAMKRQGGGQIVNIASTAARRAWPNASAYHASKWGLLGFSHALHAELRSHGIKVTAVLAGGMRTPFLLDRFPDIDIGTLQDPAAVAETVRMVLTMPAESVVAEIMVLPMRETSWP